MTLGYVFQLLQIYLSQTRVNFITQRLTNHQRQLHQHFQGANQRIAPPLIRVRFGPYDPILIKPQYKNSRSDQNAHSRPLIPFFKQSNDTLFAKSHWAQFTAILFLPGTNWPNPSRVIAVKALGLFTAHINYRPVSPSVGRWPARHLDGRNQPKVALQMLSDFLLKKKKDVE